MIEGLSKCSTGEREACRTGVTTDWNPPGRDLGGTGAWGWREGRGRSVEME